MTYHAQLIAGLSRVQGTVNKGAIYIKNPVCPGSNLPARTIDGLVVLLSWMQRRCES